MKKHLLLLLVLVTLAGLLAPSTGLAQLRNVTFVVNTATVPDTLITSVTITGDKAAITNWGAGTALTNIGGDYWSGVIQFNQGDTVRYKIRVNGAWEANPLDPNGFSTDNRGLKVGNADTTLPVQFFNTKASGTPQYWRPWPTVADTMFTVYFRINMNGYLNTFNKNTDTLGVRGDKRNASWSDPGFGWSPTRYLTREATASGGGFTYDATNFWAGAIQMRKSSVAAGDTGEYKFLIGFDWGRDESNNRQFRIPVGKNDTTLLWKWFNNVAPVPAPPLTDTCLITFRTNLAYAIARGGFQIGDTVQAQSGFFLTGGSERTINLLRQGITTFYQGTDTVITRVGNTLDYQYYLLKNNSGIRENYYNFDFAGTQGSSEAERRQVVVTSKTFTIQDTSSNVTVSRRQPEFPNQTLLTKNVKVNWTVDLRPAYYQVKLGGVVLPAINSSVDTVKNVDSIKVWGVGINGPATNLPTVFPVTDWANWNRDMVADTNQRKMWDDGPGGGHGDAIANDTIYTAVLRYTTTNTKGKVFKFGIRGSDNESGFGLNHLENISDADTVYTINAQWGSINPKFYNHWDYNNRRPVLTGVEVLPGVPLVYTLEQNYPNPFNPATRIEFSIPTASFVTLRVFNVLGQEVATLVNEPLNAGNHRVNFSAAKYASGVYLYTINAGNFVSTKKMILLK